MKMRLFQWLFLPAALVLAFTVQMRAAEAQPAGKIKAVRVIGTVTMTIKETKLTSPVAPSMEISQGAVVTTTSGSSVILAFSNGATVNLGADSQLDIEQFTQDPFGRSVNLAAITQEPTKSTTKLKLTYGELVSKVAKLNAAGGSTFAVSTPVGAAGIRGTTFRIVYRVDSATGRAQFSLATLEGAVAVTLASGAVNTAAVNVTAGTEVAVTGNIDANGNVTLSFPTGTVLVATNTSTATTGEITASAEVIASAVAAIVIPPPPPAAKSDPFVEPIKPTVVSPAQ